jgi:hypothetical protein
VLRHPSDDDADMANVVAKPRLQTSDFDFLNCSSSRNSSDMRRAFPEDHIP